MPSSRNIACIAAAFLTIAIASPAAPAPDAAAPNLIPNGAFEQGIANWQPYYKGRGEASTLTPSRDAHAGKASLQVQTPGARTLEGVVTSVRNLQINTRYRVSAWVRGSGAVALAANCGGWTYGRKSKLGDAWEMREITFIAKAPAATIDIITIGKDPEKVTFWVDDVEVVALQEEKPLPAADVPPVYFEAENYPANAKIVQDPTARGAAAAEGMRWYVFMQHVPFPQTGTPVHLYVRARIDRSEKEHPIGLRKDKATIQTVALPEAGKWRWVRFPQPIVALEIGTEFAINLNGPDKSVVARVDGCLVSTDGNLSDPQLDAAAAAPSGAVVAVGRATAPPNIDGKIDDPCWKQTIEITPFTVARGEALAKEQTRAFAAWDAENLYLAFRCEAMVLAPINNRLDAFRKKARQNDAPDIFKDDFLAVLIDADANPETFYDLFVNANGAVNDALCTPPDHWGGRDTQWNGNARVASQAEDGFWTLEVALPFASLGGAPRPGNLWRICLGRNNQEQKETSAWMPLSTGFHNPADFAAIRFEDSVPAMRDLALGQFNSGENKISARLDSPQGEIPLRLAIEIAPEKGPVQRLRQDARVQADQIVQVACEIKTEGALKVRAALLNPANLAPWFRSPAWSRRITSYILKSQLKGDGVVLYVNGKKTDGDAPLVRGENVIAIQTQGPVSGSFDIKDCHFSIDETWLAAESAPDGWQMAGFDAAGWKPVPADGWKGAKAFLRKRLLVAASRFWPNWEQHGIWLAENTVQQLFFVPEGVEGARLADFRLIVETPEPLRLLGASGFYGATKLAVTPLGDFTLNGAKWTRTSVAFPKPIAHRPALRLHEYISIPIDIPLGAAAAGPQAVRYYIRAENGHVSEVPQTLKVNILPPVRGRQPDKFIVQMWAGYLTRMDDPQLARAIVAAMIRCGVNEMPLRPDGMPIRKFQLIDFKAWNINGLPWLEQHPDDALVGYTGKSYYQPQDQNLNQICTSLLLGDTPAWKYVENAVADYVKKGDPDHINWDYESSPFTSYISCYCPRCLAEFRKFAALPESEPLTIPSIKEKHPEAWMRFMHRRFADMAGRLNHAAKKAKPAVLFSVYSGYQSQRTLERYGVDWSLVAPKIDLAMCGYGRPEDELKATQEALGPTHLVLGEIVHPYNPSEMEYPSFAAHATLLRRCIDGTRGVLIYTLTQLDGRTFRAVAELSRLLADHEPFFLKRHRADELAAVDGIPPRDMAVFLDGDRRLVILLNETGKARKAKLTHNKLPPGAEVYDFYGERSLGATAAHPVEIPPFAAAAFVVAPR